MFPHEEYLSKALNESSSIHQLITDLVALWLNKMNREGNDEDFQRAMKFEKELDTFLEEYYVANRHITHPVVPRKGHNAS